MQHCHVSSNNEVSECVTFADSILCVKVEGVQQLLKMAMDNGNILETETDEPSKVGPGVQVEPSREAEEKSEDRVRKTCPFTECRIWYGPPGTRAEARRLSLPALLAFRLAPHKGPRTAMAEPSIPRCDSVLPLCLHSLFFLVFNRFRAPQCPERSVASAKPCWPSV